MPSNPMPTSPQLKSIISDLQAIDTLRQISSLLSWDQETMMPTQAIDARAIQLTTMSGLIHDAWNAPSLAEKMSKFIDLSNGTPVSDMSTDVTAFMRELYPLWKRHTQLSKPLVQALSNHDSYRSTCWQQAREQQSFSIFAPHLSEIISLTKEKSRVGVNSTYTILIDEFEPAWPWLNWMPFSPNKQPLISYRPRTKQSYVYSRPIWPTWLQYSKELMTAMDTIPIVVGYISNAPIYHWYPPHRCPHNHPNQSQHLVWVHVITIHEVGTGHEQGLDQRWAEPLRSRTVHTFMNRNRDYGRFLLVNRCHLGGLLGFMPCFHPQNLGGGLPSHRITPLVPSRIDVVTYNLHIMIRYECEKALFLRT